MASRPSATGSATFAAPQFWVIAVPLFIAFLAWKTGGAGLALALVYPLHAAVIARRHRDRGMAARRAWLWAWAAILCRFPNAIGMLRYWFRRLSGRHPTLIEYKGTN